MPAGKADGRGVRPTPMPNLCCRGFIPGPGCATLRLVNTPRSPVRLPRRDPGWPARCVALSAALCSPLPAAAAEAGRGLHPGVWLLLLPFFLGLGVGAHWLCSRALKAILRVARPLARGEPEIAGYERKVYHTADPQLLGVVGAALVAGLLLWLGAWTASAWAWLPGIGSVALALGLDLWFWQRVAVSAENVWFQRGWIGTVHQVAIENIREVEVHEADAPGLTLRHGRNNRCARLSLHLRDHSVAALPKTDADGGLDEVEAVANQLRMRQAQLSGREALSRAESDAQRNAAAAAAAAATPSVEREMRRELRRLRQKALAPDAPPAVKTPPEA